MIHDLFPQAYEAWKALDPSLKAPLIGAAATLTASIGAASVVFWQIGKQARNAVDQSNKNEATKLKLQIYEEILAICKTAAEAELEFASFVRMFPHSLQMVRFNQERNYPWSPPNERFPTLSHLRGDAHTKAIGVITAVENWGIVDPRMAVFQTAMNAALFDFLTTSNKYIELTMKMFPVPLPGDNTKTYPWSLPSPDIITELERATEAVLDSNSTLGNYIHDFRVEMQSALVGGIFPGHDVPARRPLDPRHRVISLKQHAELTRYFENETEWGIYTKRIRESVTPKRE